MAFAIGERVSQLIKDHDDGTSYATLEAAVEQGKVREATKASLKENYGQVLVFARKAKENLKTKPGNALAPGLVALFNIHSPVGFCIWDAARATVNKARGNR